MGRKKKPVSTALTDLELVIMTVLWRFGCAAVKDVQEVLVARRPLAYTTLSTVLRSLESRGLVQSEKEGRQHVYLPILDKVEYEKLALKKCLDEVFEGSAERMIDVLQEMR